MLFNKGLLFFAVTSIAGKSLHKINIELTFIEFCDYIFVADKL